MQLHYLGISFGVHVVASCIFTSDGYGLVAAAASPSLQDATERACKEALQGMVAATRLVGKARLNEVSEIRTTSDHALYYFDRDRFENVAAICNGEYSFWTHEIAAATPEPANLRQVVESPRSAGFEPVAVDLTTRDIAMLGLCVVRVVVPGFQPLVFGSACIHVPDTRRVEQWRAIWNLADGNLNSLPHPFP